MGYFMEKLQLKVENRQEGINLNSLRSSGRMPAVVYGNSIKPMNLSVAQNEFEKVLRVAGESTLVELQMSDGSVKNVLVHDLQRDPVTHTIIHADFLEVDMSQTLTANVPLEFTGEAMAVKALGGTLVKVLNEVEVECLPSDLPHNIEVDISSLQTFEDLIAVKDIQAPAKVKITTEPEEVVAKVQPPRDVEAELESQLGDVTAVEGVAETEAPADGEAKAENEPKAE